MLTNELSRWQRNFSKSNVEVKRSTSLKSNLNLIMRIMKIRSSALRLLPRLLSAMDKYVKFTITQRWTSSRKSGVKVRRSVVRTI